MTNKFDSIKKFLPNKVIAGDATTLQTLESWLYDDGLGDTWWQGANGAAYKWKLTATINPTLHSSHLTRSPKTYDALDISPGMWVMSYVESKALRVVSILSKTPDTIECIVEDVDRYNTFNDPNQLGLGSFGTPSSILFFELGDDGLPILSPLPIALDSAIIVSQVEARFRVFNPTAQVSFYQVAHAFNSGDVLKLDSVSKIFVKASADDIYIAGTVTAVGPGPNYFYLSPSTKFITDLSPSLPGNAGSIIWIDPETKELTTTPNIGKSPEYIQMTDAIPTYVIGLLDNPTTWDGTQITINKSLITLTGSLEITSSEIIDAINALTTEHGCVASFSPPANTFNGVNGFYSTTIDGQMQFKVNGALITVTGPSIFYGTSGDIDNYDLMRCINEMTYIHGVYTTVDPDHGWLSFSQAAGGSIDFENVFPLTSTSTNKTFIDFVGVSASNPSGNATRLKLVRNDGGEIIISNIAGTFTDDVGLQSAENGQRPIALVVDKSISATSTSMATDLAALNAIQNPRSGDQVYVQNGKTPGEWELYVRTGATWTLIADHDSAKTDASTMTVEVSKTSPASVSLGNMSNGTRIVNVTVVVSEAFSSAASLNVGTDDAIDVVLNDDIIDLSIVGSYESNTTYIYSGVADGELFVHLDSASSTSGKAKVIVSYL